MNIPEMLDKHNTSNLGSFTTEEIIVSCANTHRILSTLTVDDPVALYFMREFQTFQNWLLARIELGYTPVDPCLVFANNSGLIPKIAKECRDIAECYGGAVFFSESPKYIILKGAATVVGSDAWQLANSIKADIRGTSMKVSESGAYSVVRELT